MNRACHMEELLAKTTMPEGSANEQAYREAVEALIALESDRVITNELPAHAAILFEAFFKHADTDVRIFCRNLNQQVFGRRRLVAEAASALDRGVRIQVLTQEEPQDGPFLHLLNERQKD